MDSLSGYVCVPPLQDLTSYQGYLLAFDLGSLANNLVSIFEGGYPGGSDGKKKKICLQCRRPRFHPWVRKIHCRREWLPTPVYLPREFYGQRSLAGYSPWGLKESDASETTEHTRCVNTQWTITQPQKKERKKAISSNMDGPGDNHTK